MTRFRISALVVLGALLRATSAQAAEAIPWRNGFILNGDAGLLQMSEKGGFAKAYGLDLETLNLRGDPLLLKSLVSGQLDSYVGGPASPMVAASKGADVKIIGCGWHKQSYVLWGNSKVKSLDDMRGRTIGISSPGSAPDIFIRAALATRGIAADEVKFVAAGMPSDWLKSMSAGVIDAAATPDEYKVRGEKLGLKVLTSSDEATPLSMQRCYFTTAAMLRDHKDRVARFLAAEMAAYDFALTHREPTIALARRLTNAAPDAPEAEASYDSVVARHVIDPSLEPPMEKLRWLRDVLAENKLIDRNWDPAKMIDRSALGDARKLFAAQKSDVLAAGATSLLTAQSAARK